MKPDCISVDREHSSLANAPDHRTFTCVQVARPKHVTSHPGRDGAKQCREQGFTGREGRGELTFFNRDGGDERDVRTLRFTGMKGIKGIEGMETLPKRLGAIRGLFL